MWLLIFPRLHFVFLGQGARSGRKHGCTTIYQFLQLFLWDRHIRWANPEQSSVPATVLPVQRVRLPLGKRLLKQVLMSELLINERIWVVLTGVLNLGTFYFNWGFCWKYFLDALSSPILCRKPVVGSKTKTKDELLQKIWLRLFKWRFWIKHTCLRS